MVIRGETRWAGTAGRQSLLSARIVAKVCALISHAERLDRKTHACGKALLAEGRRVGCRSGRVWSHPWLAKSTRRRFLASLLSMMCFATTSLFLMF